MEIEPPFVIGSWLVEPSEYRISKPDQSLNLDPRIMDVLVYLARNQGRIISKDVLMNNVWDGVVVSDNTLAQTISRLRSALGDDWQNPSYIETVSKKGYRLVAPVGSIGDGQYLTKEAQPDLADLQVTIGGSSILSQTQESSLSRSGFVLAMSGLTLVALVLLILNVADIGTVALPAIEPSTLSASLGLERYPKISPDGSMYAYVAADNGSQEADIFVRPVDSHDSQRLTIEPGPDVYPEWTSNGQSLIYVARVGDQQCGFFERSILGGPRRQIGDCLRAPGKFDIHPVTNDIVFASADSFGTPRRLYILNRKTGESTPLTDYPQEGAGDNDPVYSPDGSYVVFRRSVEGHSELFRVPSNGGTTTRITYGNRSTIGHSFLSQEFLHSSSLIAGLSQLLDLLPGKGDTDAPDLSHLLDGDLIIYSSNRSGRRRLWLTSAEGGNPVPIPLGDRVPLDPSATAAGDRFIFRSVVDQARLWRFDLEGQADPVAIAHSTRTEIHPAIDPTGSRVAFLSSRTDHFEVWSSTNTGDDLRKHTNLGGAFVNAPSWSASGIDILLDASTANDADLYRTGLDSPILTTVVNTPNETVNGFFSRDGRYVYYSSDESGQLEIWRSDLANGSKQRLTRNGGFVVKPDSEGRYIYYTKFGQAGVWKAPIDQGADEEFVEDLIYESLHPMDGASWQVASGGLYFVCRNPDAVCHLDFETREVARVLAAPKPIPVWSGPALSVAPDEKWLVLAMTEQMEDEIKYVDF